jgi:hypothetical protein
MNYHIKQGDKLPNIFIELSAEYPVGDDIPEEDKRIYDKGDELVLLISRNSKDWLERDVEIYENQDNRLLRVRGNLLPEDVEDKGRYVAVVRNKTMEATFPTRGTLRIRVE